MGGKAKTAKLRIVCTGRTPTKSTSEKKVPFAGNPWETGSEDGKYQYYPGGDRSAEPKDAPSAVNVVVIPDVNLPKVRFFSGNDRQGPDHSYDTSAVVLGSTTRHR